MIGIFRDNYKGGLWDDDLHVFLNFARFYCT